MKLSRRFFIYLLALLPTTKLDKVRPARKKTGTSHREAMWYRKLIILLPIILMIGLAGCHKKGEKSTASQRPPSIFYPAVSGGFYPGNPEELRSMLRSYDSAVTSLPETDGRILGLISPHAGYIYAAPVAIYGYKFLKMHREEIPHTIVIIGISHYFSRPYIATITDDYYLTPLGRVRIAVNLIKELIKHSNGLVVKDDTLFRREHSVETQIPYLQFELGNDIRIIPLVMGTQDFATSERLGKLLRRVIGAKALYIASTDLSHYHSYHVAVKLDHETIDYISRGDPEILYTAIRTHRVEMCSWGPVIAVLTALRKEFDEIRLLKYANSGDTAGPKNRVVGYASMVILNNGRKKEGKMDLEKLTDERLTDKERIFLLKLARQTIANALEGKDPPDWEPPTRRLYQPGAVFVTLKERGELRGCIGSIIPHEPLIEDVKHMAIQAAFHDPRFPPLRKEELPLVTIEISRLTPIVPVRDISEIKVGRDGLIITKGYHRGLLLPQVPVEYGWDLYTFLDHTCLKAGLPPGCWKDPDTRIEKFSAEVWDEDEYRDQLK